MEYEYEKYFVIQHKKDNPNVLLVYNTNNDKKYLIYYALVINQLALCLKLFIKYDFDSLDRLDEILKSIETMFSIEKDFTYTVEYTEINTFMN